MNNRKAAGMKDQEVSPAKIETVKYRVLFRIDIIDYFKIKSR